MAVPPVRLILVFGAGLAFREEAAEPFFEGGAKASDISCPAAEGGALDAVGLAVGAAVSVMSGICLASGLLWSARLSATCCL